MAIYQFTVKIFIGIFGQMFAVVHYETPRSDNAPKPLAFNRLDFDDGVDDDKGVTSVLCVGDAYGT